MMMEQATAELLEQVKRGNETLVKQLRMQRVVAGLLCVLVVVLAVFSFTTYTKLDAAAKALESVDFAGLSQKLSQLDMDALNGAVSALEKTVSGLDVEKFNDTLGTLSGTVSSLQSAADSFNTFAKKLSGLFGA